MLFADIAAGRSRYPVDLGIALIAVVVWAVEAVAAAAPRQGDPGGLSIDRFALVLTAFCAATGSAISIPAALVGRATAAPAASSTRSCSAPSSMSVLSAAVDLVTLYLAFEDCLITGYVLNGMRRADRLANEASMKYVLFGRCRRASCLRPLARQASGGTSLEAVRVAVARRPRSPRRRGVVPSSSGSPSRSRRSVPVLGARRLGRATAVGGFLAVAPKAAGLVSLVRVAGAMARRRPRPRASSRRSSRTPARSSSCSRSPRGPHVTIGNLAPAARRT